MKKIVVIGSSNTDLVVKTNAMPQPGETVIGGSFIMAGGGKGANQAVTIARLGGDITFIAKVGDDLFGNQAIAGYLKDNLNTDYIIKDPETSSGVALITVDRKGENCIVVAPGANNKLNKADIDSVKKLIEEAGFLLMQLEIPLDVVEYAASIASAAGVKIILNPAPATEIPASLLEKLYLITPNETEGKILAGNKDGKVENIAESLLKKGVENVIVTLGSRGSFIKSCSFSGIIPARKVETVVDTTGAGDVFNGALCVALAENRNLEEAVKFATCASAISITRMGAQPSIPVRTEVKY